MKETLTCVVVDDDPLFATQMEAYLDEISWLQLVETHTQPVKAAKAILAHKPDLIFLDIEMPHVDGYSLIDWLLPYFEKMEKRPHVVVISAKKQVPHEVGETFLCYISKSSLSGPEYLSEVVKHHLIQSSA